jgi:hypothetical protein
VANLSNVVYTCGLIFIRYNYPDTFLQNGEKSDPGGQRKQFLFIIKFGTNHVAPRARAGPNGPFSGRK